MQRQDRGGLRRAVCSAQFEKLLFKRHPDWRSLARYRTMQDVDGEARAYLHLDVPSANEKVSESLSIETYPNSVIVSWFHGMHAHFDWQPDYRRAAVEYIAEILDDTHGFAVLKPDGHHILRSWLGSQDKN